MTKNRHILLITLIIVFILVMVGLSIFSAVRKQSAAPKTNIVILDNASKYSSGVDDEVFSAIEKMNYKIVAFNITKPETVYHGVIRANSFKKITSNSVSFIIDIPSIKMSWYASEGINEKGKALSDALVECIAEKDVIYTYDANCKDNSNADNGSIDSAGFDMAKDLPLTGQNYSINYTYSDIVGSNGYAVILTYYTPTGQQEGLNALTSLGYDVTKYTFTYIDGS